MNGLPPPFAARRFAMMRSTIHLPAPTPDGWTATSLLWTCHLKQFIVPVDVLRALRPLETTGFCWFQLQKSLQQHRPYPETPRNNNLPQFQHQWRRQCPESPLQWLRPVCPRYRWPAALAPHQEAPGSCYCWSLAKKVPKNISTEESTI